jgi:hypothetical protein
LGRRAANRMGAGRLHHIARVLDVRIEFFYEGASSDQGANGPIMVDGQSRSITDFLATSEGLELVRAFTAIKDSKVRRRIVDRTRLLAHPEHWRCQSSDGGIHARLPCGSLV